MLGELLKLVVTVSELLLYIRPLRVCAFDGSEREFLIVLSFNCEVDSKGDTPPSDFIKTWAKLISSGLNKFILVDYSKVRDIAAIICSYKFNVTCPVIDSWLSQVQLFLTEPL